MKLPQAIKCYLCGDLAALEQKYRSVADLPYPQMQSVVTVLITAHTSRTYATLCLLAGKHYDAPPEALIPVSASLELLAAAITAQAGLKPDTHDLKARVLAGDYVSARAAAFADESGSVDVMRTFSDALAAMCQGHIARIQGLPQGHDGHNALYVAAVEAGAMLGGAPDHEREALRAFAAHLKAARSDVEDPDCILDALTSSEARDLLCLLAQSMRQMGEQLLL